MIKFYISSLEDLLVMRDILDKNDIPAQLTHLYDENAKEIGASLKVADKIYLWNMEEADSVG